MNFFSESDLDSSAQVMNAFHELDFPVYRSIAIEQYLPQQLETFSAPPPTLSKSSSPFFLATSSFPKESSTVITTSTSSSCCDQDLMEFLNDTLGECEIAKVEDLGFSSLSQTTVYFDDEKDSYKLIEIVNHFLNQNQIFNERKGDSKWICESIIQVENIKFQIQIFSTSTGFAVEFLRLRGCSLTFSSIFRQFRSQENSVVSKVVPLQSTSTLQVEDEKESINSLVCYLNENPIEAVKMICSMISIICQYTEVLTQICHFLIERKEVCSILTLACHLNSRISRSNISSLNNADHFLKLYDQLVPSLVKYSFDSTQSAFIKHQSSELMQSRMAMNSI